MLTDLHGCAYVNTLNMLLGNTSCVIKNFRKHMQIEAYDLYVGTFKVNVTLVRV